MHEHKELSVEELTNLNSSALLYKLDYLRERTIKTGYEFAEAEKAYNDFKTLMPSFLAEYIGFYLKDYPLNTARVMALGDKDYQAKVKEMNVAEYESRLKEVEYKSYMESIKALTAISYLRNAEARIERH